MPWANAADLRPGARTPDWSCDGPCVPAESWVISTRQVTGAAIWCTTTLSRVCRNCSRQARFAQIVHKSSALRARAEPGPCRSPRDVSAPSNSRGGGLQCWLVTQVPPPHGCQESWPSYGEDTESRFEAVHATAALAWGSSGMAACSRTQRVRAAGRTSIYAHVSRERGEFVQCKFAIPDHLVHPYMSLFPPDDPHNE
jgi:hypothetical protein